MDVGNGWNAGGCPRAAQDPTIFNRIMLKFRPIAPKPVVGGSGSASAPEENKTDVVSKRRSKRKYVRVKKKVSRCYNTSKNNKKNEQVGKVEEKEEEKRRDPHGFHTSLLTLQLLPESSSNTGVNTPKKTCFETMLNFSSAEAEERPLWMMDNHRDNVIGCGGWADQADRRMRLRVVESWVMVDGMSNTWVDGGALGSTDMEKMKNLEVDTCPGLISDGLDRVQWVNLAYRRMVDPLHGGGGPPAEVVARLVVKDKIRTGLPGANFACTVRVMYTRQSGKHTQTMPCDVWKMDFGGFAWRFDSKAALCLGR